jgi:hypothetical protein
LFEHFLGMGGVVGGGADEVDIQGIDEGGANVSGRSHGSDSLMATVPKPLES